MATTKKIRGATILKQMLSDKKAFKDAVQGSKNISEVIIKLDKLNQKRAKRTAL